MMAKRNRGTLRLWSPRHLALVAIRLSLILVLGAGRVGLAPLAQAQPTAPSKASRNAANEAPPPGAANNALSDAAPSGTYDELMAQGERLSRAAELAEAARYFQAAADRATGPAARVSQARVGAGGGDAVAARRHQGRQ